MMYRRSAALTPRMDHRAAATQISWADTVKGAVLAMLAQVGILSEAERANRRWDRINNRRVRHTTYFRNGLNGTRAVKRRQRQIERGQLTAPNGLVG